MIEKGKKAAKNIYDTYNNSGPEAAIRRAVQILYTHTIRPYTGLQSGKTNGSILIPDNAEVPENLLIKKYDKYITPSLKYYKSINSEMIHKYSTEGDSIVIVGGGHGVTSVAAAKSVGAEGCVDIFEGSRDRVKTIKDTLCLNDVVSKYTVHHEVVGTRSKVVGSINGADTVHPKTLPKSDLIEIDCEGAELDILKNIVHEPKYIIAETHPNERSTKELILNVLTGYRLIECIEDPHGGSIVVFRTS